MFCSQGWFPAAFLLDENAVKPPENFKVISDYKAAGAQELSAKKGQVTFTRYYGDYCLLLISAKVMENSWLYLV